MINFDIGDSVYFDESPQADGKAGNVHPGRVEAVTGDTVFLSTPPRKGSKGLYPVHSRQILMVRQADQIPYNILDRINNRY